jgi:surface protein
MEYENISKNNNKGIISNKSGVNFDKIKSNCILSKIYNNLSKKYKLMMIKYNKRLQNRLNISIKDYIKFCVIEIEIILCGSGKFININENYKSYYHIYFNESKEETKNKYFIFVSEGVTKIRIIIDYQVNSLKGLFSECECIESINFKKFSKDNIIDMSYMFFECSSLKELNLSKINTKNVTNISRMFSGCSLLKELGLSNFNTNNVTNMSGMFRGCSSLKELDLSNFNTNNVTNMSCMFSRCSSLKKLNLSNFNTNNITDISLMFYKCISLKEIKINNFICNNVTKFNGIFEGCSEDLKKIIKS